MHDRTRLQGLDGLRGVAILLVVVYHLWTELSGQRILPAGSPWTFLYAGNTGVTLFFLLSGFLVGLPFIKAFGHGQLPSLRLYALHRALRILPPYYFVGLIGILLTGQTQQLLPMLLFSAEALDVGYFSTVWWSLSTEVQFYFLIPVIFIAVAGKKFRKILLFIVGALLLTAHLLVIFKEINPGLVMPENFEFQFRLILSAIGQMPAFLTGLVLAALYHHYPSRMISHLHGMFGSLALVSLLGVALLPQAKEGALIFMWSTPSFIWLESLLWGGIVWIMLNRQPPPISVFDNRLTRYFGKISFSLYLVHMPILGLTLKQLGASNPFVDFLIAIILSVTTAQMCYWIVERPFLNLKTKLSQPYLSKGKSI